MDEGERIPLVLKKENWNEASFSTRAVHAGQESDPLTGAVNVPIYETSTFAQESPGKTKGYEYSRTGNPTRLALERSIASLEQGKFGLAFSSGMGAISTAASTLRAGDSVLICDDSYGGTYRLFSKVFSKFSIHSDFVDASKLDLLEAALKKKSYSFLLVESPTNPMMKVIDLKESSAIAHACGTKVVVDNTFATPYLTNPLTLGADTVVHSTTKYLGGHSDVIGGAIVTNDEKTYEDLKFLQNAMGAVPSPFDCFLILRGIRTLPLRMDRHCENAMSIALFLQSLKEEGNVRSVNYPGLEENQYRKTALKQMKKFGGMLSFEMNSNEEARRFVESLQVFTLAESLGGVESLIELPAIMTHASIPEQERLEKGVSDSLVRISAGIEDKEDLIKDLKQGFEQSKKKG